MSERISLAAHPIDPNRAAILKAGTSGTGLVFPASLLEASAHLFEGAPCYIDHPGPADWGRPGSRSVRDLAATIRDVRYDRQLQALIGRLSWYANAAWLRELASRAAEPSLDGHQPKLGLSADLWITREGSQVRTIESVESVDVVMNPAAGGAFLPAPRIAQSSLTALASARSPERSSMAQPERTQLTSDGTRVPRPATNPRPDPQSPVRGASQGTPKAVPTAQPSPTAQRPSALTVRELQLQLALERSNLPENARSAVRGLLAGRDYTSEDVAATIRSFTDAYAQAAATNTVRGSGALSGMLEPVDRIALAFERLMGLPRTADHDRAARLSGIREMYDLLTGDYERHGIFRPQRVTLANATVSTMAQVCANVLNKVMIRAFEQRPRWWDRVAYQDSFATMNDVKWIVVGGFSDLDTVAEGGSYAEKTWDDYAESSSFVKKGNYIGITLEMIDRDDVAAVRAIPRKLGLAAYRTLSTTAAALFTDNSGAGVTLSDSINLFHDDHSNLGSTALSATSWGSTTAAMFKRTEYNSSKRLSIRPCYCMIPIDLEKTALEIFTSDVAPTADAFYRNVYRTSQENIVIVPDWTDTNDWVAAADPTDLEGLCIGYRFGRSPELFVAEGDLMGSMFTNDEMRIKCRFVFTCGIGDYRALYKHIVT